MSKKKGMRSRTHIASLFVWALLSLAAGGLAVETLLIQNDSSFTTLLTGDTSEEQKTATPAATPAAVPATQSVAANAFTNRRQRILEDRLAVLTRSLADVRKNNAALISQQTENQRRLARMEDAFESITASLKPPEPVQAPQLPDGALPLPTLKPTSSNQQTENPQSEALSQTHIPFPITSKDEIFDEVERREITPDLVIASPDLQPRAQVMQTEFAVSVAHYMDIEVLVQSWFDLHERHYETLQNLQPRIRFEKTIGNGLELALIAGPLRNAGDAALLCVELGLADKGCKPVVYSGEPIPTLASADIPQ